MVRAAMEDSPTVMIVVALALLDGRGRVLMQRRPAGKAHGGLWEFPGGKVEAGERCESALVRETGEELGIRVNVADLSPVSFATGLCADGVRPLLLLLYAAREWEGAPEPVEPGSALAWVSAAGLSRLAMPPLDIPLAGAVIPLLEGLPKQRQARKGASPKHP